MHGLVKNLPRELNGPVISVVIPTRERADTLFHTLLTALSQKSQDYEVVISDNYSNDNTRDMVSKIDDNRIRYFNTEKRMSMCDNYEFALSKCRGEYVIIIGDDDAVMPGRLDDLIALLKELPEPMIHMWPLHIYDWPVENKLASIAYLAPVKAPSRLNLKDKARFVVGSGGWKYYELPSPYHSAIPIGILNEVRERTGRVFHSTQPDVFTAMAIPAFADYAINIGRTVTLNGRSSRSNGLGFVKRNARVNIERFISEYGDYKFHPSLYGGVSGLSNMIPDAVLLAKDFFPELYAEVKFNYSAMWAYICRIGFIGHIEVLKEWRKIGAQQPIGCLSFLGYSLIHELSAIRRIILNKVSKLKKRDNKIPENINKFVVHLTQTTELVIENDEIR